MKLEQKWYSAARGTLFTAVLLLCLAGGVRGGLGLVFLALGVVAAAAFSGNRTAPSPLSQLRALHPALVSHGGDTILPRLRLPLRLEDRPLVGKSKLKDWRISPNMEKEDAQMSFEAEVIPLFIGGVIAVSAVEFFMGWLGLRKRKDVRGLFAGHVVTMLLGFFFLIRSLFANWLGVSLGIASISNSVNVGLFGLCWAVSAICVAVMISRLAAPRQ